MQPVVIEALVRSKASTLLAIKSQLHFSSHANGSWENQWQRLRLSFYANSVEIYEPTDPFRAQLRFLLMLGTLVVPTTQNQYSQSRNPYARQPIFTGRWKIKVDAHLNKNGRELIKNETRYFLILSSTLRWRRIVFAVLAWIYRVTTC